MRDLKCYFIQCIYLLSSTILSAQNIAEFYFDEISGSTNTIESISNTVFHITNHFNKPERISGIKGNALRLDGYSTWAYNDSFTISGVNNRMTISAWYATEAFNKEPGSIISMLDTKSGFALSVGPYGNIILEFFADGTENTLQTEQAIEKYKWNYIVATIDLPNKKARIFVNGNEWQTLNISYYNSITLSNTKIYIGRHNREITNAGFLLTALNGAIDEIKITNVIMPDVDIETEYRQYDKITPNLNIDPYIRYAGDFLRPKFHAMPNVGWTNEPYGLIFTHGKYHLFFQKNPNSPTLYFMHWGHLSSPDLVNWTEEKIALAPSPGFDSFGVWSGSSTIDSTGSPVLIYTGVDGIKAGIGVAYPVDDDLSIWSKYVNNPVIPSPPSNYQVMDFRDPFVWKLNGYFYMIIGSGIQNSGGGIVFLYRSKDLINWTTLPPLFKNVYVSESGYFWEMPFFFPLNSNNEYILGVVPIPTQNKPAETIYWIGKFENERFRPYFTNPKKFEIINGLMLSPALGKDTAGRITYIGIIPEDRSESAQINAEWRHTFTIPRQLRLLTDSTVGHTPHPNLCRLRDTLIHVSNRIILPNTSFNLPEFFGNQAELSFKIKADSATRFAIHVFKNEDGREFTSLVFDLSINRVAFDRGHSSLSSGTPTDYRSVEYIFNYHDTISIDIFLDHSIIEVFIDNLAVYSMRVYPSRAESQKMDLVVSKGKVELISLDKWKLKDMKDVSTNEVCERTNLPEKYRKISDLIGSSGKREKKKIIKIYPNPANDKVSIQNTELNSYASISITNTLGKILYIAKLNSKSGNSVVLDTSEWEQGVYIINVATTDIKYNEMLVIMH